MFQFKQSCLWPSTTMHSKNCMHNYLYFYILAINSRKFQKIKFINCIKCTTLVVDVDKGGGCACVE